jgi:hypothetical protein
MRAVVSTAGNLFSGSPGNALARSFEVCGSGRVGCGFVDNTKVVGCLMVTLMPVEMNPVTWR